MHLARSHRAICRLFVRRKCKSKHLPSAACLSSQVPLFPLINATSHYSTDSRYFWFCCFFTPHSHQQVHSLFCFVVVVVFLVICVNMCKEDPNILGLTSGRFASILPYDFSAHPSACCVLVTVANMTLPQLKLQAIHR